MVLLEHSTHELFAPADIILLACDIHTADSFQLCDEYYSIDLGSQQARAAVQALPAPDLILHAGGISGFMVETDNPARIADVNIFGTLQLLESGATHEVPPHRPVLHDHGVWPERPPRGRAR